MDRTAVDIINTALENFNSNPDFGQTTTAFRYLRNICGSCRATQNEILQESNILFVTERLLFNILTCGKVYKEKLLCSQIGLQFLCNLVVDNENNQERVWHVCQDLFDVCLKFQDEKVQSVCARTIYNIFLGKPEFANQLRHPLEALIELTVKENTGVIPQLTLEIFILKSDYVFKHYEKIKPENRLLVLELIKGMIADEEEKVLQPKIIQFFSTQFTEKSDLILKTSGDYSDSLNPVEVVKILDLLVTFSMDEKSFYLEIIQLEVSLLINCVMLLSNIHLISKEAGNNFSMIGKLSQMDETENNSLQEHPAFGFKCSLIRLIGNLCWKNPLNQNKVRELDGIQLLLDCCNMDARNPFIIQWCIFAIRNICEKNAENQKVIASISREGLIDSSRLQELGITLNKDGNGDEVCIAPWK